MTTGTSDETRPSSEALITRIRVVRIKPQYGTECYIAFTEKLRADASPERLSTTFLTKAIGHRFDGKLTIESFAEDPALSALATKIYASLRAGNDETRALEIIGQFVARAGVLAVMTESRP